jgi:hypothetical protein
MDPFQSQPPKQLVKAAKTVQVIKPGQKEEVVPAENLNTIALQFIRTWKRQRSAQG